MAKERKKEGINMKKFLFLIAVLSAMLFTTTAFAIQGEGTEESPFLITNQEELMLVSDFPECHFKLVNDIELEGEFVPLCKDTDGFKGVLDGNGKTISNLTINQSMKYTGMFSRNEGVITNLKVVTSEGGVTNQKEYTGILVGKNNGEISYCTISGIVHGNLSADLNNSYSAYSYTGGVAGENVGEIIYVLAEGKFEGKCSTYSSYSFNYYAYSYTGGIVGKNSGKISCVSVEGDISSYSSGSSGAYSYAYSGGVAGKNDKIISYVSVEANIYSDSKLTDFDYMHSYAGGIVGESNGYVVSDSYFIGSLRAGGENYGICEGIVGNCYAVSEYVKLPTYIKGVYKYPVSNSAQENSFYDQNVSGISGYSYGKTTREMKMKETYTDAGWDFENVWGIDENINDGYPYLLWEYAETDSASAEITSASSTSTSLKFISTVITEGEPEIATFGTTFIPLWLFETGSSDVATVSYDNSKYNIQNGQTFGATLSNIPEAAKDMMIVGKSFVKDAEGNYTWSAAKSASVNDTELVEVN